MPFLAVRCSDQFRVQYGGKVAHTLNSHRLVDWAAQFGLDKQDATINALFNAYVSALAACTRRFTPYPPLLCAV